MELNGIIIIISTAVSIIGIVYSFIATILKGKKSKLVRSAQILQELPTYITEAETIFGSKTGVAKLAYVLSKINIACIQEHLKFDEEAWKNQVEDILQTPQKKEV